MKKEELKKRVCDEIENYRDFICSIGNDIYHHPELGYKEINTSQKVCEVFDQLGMNYEKNIGITGIKAYLKPKSEGVHIGILSELDAVVCPDHPDADRRSGAAHTCGHFAQVAGMIGCAIGLKAIQDELTEGNVSFIASPAEECVEIEYRKKLIEEGKISYLGGKQELIHQGVFNDIDIAMLIHGMKTDEVIKATSNGTGFIAKTIRFIGKEAHAGLEPWNGNNALSAANLAINAINSIRDTFKPEDCVKIHYIMTKGGTLVNIVPDDVRIEMYIRAASIEAIKDANLKVNRAIKGCAYALGCESEIFDLPGYLPLISNDRLGEIFKENAQSICPNTSVIKSTEVEGISTDMGDLTNLIPCVQAGIGGFVNGFHTKDFRIENEELAYIIPAKILACTVIDLLVDEGKQAKEVIKNYHSAYSKESYDEIWKEIMGK